MNDFRWLPVWLMLLGPFACPTPAQVPALLSNQGRLHDGERMLNGDVTMVLRVYTNAVGGEYLYEDTSKVTIVDGYYFTYLGDNTTSGSLAEALAGGEAYVEVIVDGVTYPPRELIPAVAYAFKADLADAVKPGGVNATMIAPRAVETSHLAVGAVTETRLADGAVSETKLAPALRDRLAEGAGPAAPAPAGPSAASPFQRVSPGPNGPNLVAGHIANHARPGVSGTTVSGGGTAGEPNVAGGDHAAIGGGLGNRADAPRATVAGGRLNVADGSSSLIGGGYSNRTASGYATVAGGYGNTATGYVSTVGGGWANTAAGAVAGVGGGQDNRADGAASTVAGGWANQASGFGAAIAGGQGNTAQGPHASVGGGTNNLATGDASTVPGGRDNSALGRGSLAAGTGARALHDGTWVWSDDQAGPFESTGHGQFLVRARGNVGIDTDDPEEKLTVAGNIAPDRSGAHNLGTRERPWDRVHVVSGIDARDTFSITHGDTTNLVVLADGTVIAPLAVVAGRFEGDGSGLTGVSAGALEPGSITDAEISPAAGIDPAKVAGRALTRATLFDGDVAGTAQDLALRDGAITESRIADGAVTAAKLGDGAVTREKLADDLVDSLRQSDAFWRVGGNDSAGGAEQVLGTRNEQALEFRVNDRHALRLEPAEETPNVVGGNAGNLVAGGVRGAVISGGGGTGGVNQVTGNFSAVGGGLSNTAGNEYATVGGGINNTAAGSAATVAGGWRNAANDLNATVGGGQDNTSGGLAATVGGGFKNSATGDYATVPGGSGNTARGDHSYAAGQGARALQDGSFVWSDASGGEFESTAPNQFLVRATGNVGIDVTRPEEKLTVQGNVAPGESASFALGTPGLRWHSVYLSSHVDFQDDLQWVSGNESRMALDRDGNLLARGRVTAAAFVGDGAGLSGIDGSGIAAGSIYDAQVSQVAGIDPRKIAGIALTEATRYSGDVSGGFKSLVLNERVVDTGKLADGAVTGSKLRRGAVNLIHLDDTVKDAMDSAATSWSRGGNAGTRGGIDYLGTSDRQPLELRVDGNRALLIQPTSGSPNLAGGDARNRVDGSAVGGTIGGGGSVSNPNRVGNNYGTVAGGVGNEALNEYATVGGGFGNVARGFDATISGGQDNQGSGSGSAIGGGFTNLASGSFATIAGGANNVAAGNVATVAGGFGNEARGPYASVTGGSRNRADGEFSQAGGRRARANHPGAFVWADSRDRDFASTGPNQFLIRAAGGVGINLERPAYPLHLAGGAYSTGAVWVNASDRDLKENFAEIDPDTILERLVALPILAWNYKADEPSVRHVGPTAQDFHQAFGIGNNDRSISTVDASGVALAAIQALHADNRELREQNQALQARLDALEERLHAPGPAADAR